jgi:hypothetical protein
MILTRYIQTTNFTIEQSHRSKTTFSRVILPSIPGIYKVKMSLNMCQSALTLPATTGMKEAFDKKAWVRIDLMYWLHLLLYIIESVS